jgi:mono/diheme cytochrome c family protein
MRSQIILILALSVIATMIYSCQNPEQITQKMYYTNGSDLYVKRCENCHGKKAEGLANLIPALTDTIFLSQNKKRLACIIKNGLNEKLTINGVHFQEKMPANADLTDIDLAQIIVYITNSNGSNQGMYRTDQVAEDLQRCK